MRSDYFSTTSKQHSSSHAYSESYTTQQKLQSRFNSKLLCSDQMLSAWAFHVQVWECLTYQKPAGTNKSLSSRNHTHSCFALDIRAKDRDKNLLCTMQAHWYLLGAQCAEPSATHRYPETSEAPLWPIMPVLISPATNEVVMELQLLAEIANDIFFTGHVFSAGETWYHPTGQRGEKKGCGHPGPDKLVLYWCVCVCV